MKRSLGIFIIIVFAIIALVGTYYIYQWQLIVSDNTNKILNDAKTLDSRGVKTTAKITKTKEIYSNGGGVSRDDDGKQRFETDYQFEVGGKTYSGKAHIGLVNRQDPIEIVYDPQNPENNGSPAELRPLEFSFSPRLITFAVFFGFIVGFYRIISKYINSLPID